jgi:hypothetical protein
MYLQYYSTVPGVSGLQQLVLPSGRVCHTEASAAPGRVSPTAVCAVPGPVCVSVLQQSVISLLGSDLQLLVLHLDVFIQQQPVLCQDVYSIAYSSLCCIFIVCRAAS